MYGICRTARALSLGLAALLLTAAPALADPPSEDAIRAAMSAVNADLAAADAGFRLEVVESLAARGTATQGQTVFFDNRTFELGHHFVPGDPRRGGFSDIRWINDLLDGATDDGLTAAMTDGAILRAMDSWQGVDCSTLPLTHLGSFDDDFGVVQSILGFGGNPDFFADVTHAGWLSLAFFEAVFGPAAPNVIGVTFTFLWVDDDGEFTDIDNNGRLDTAFREIYYNDFFTWQIDGDIDVETVALHEAGHGLSQGHFGKAFRTDANGVIHFAPRAVMNAAYSGVQQEFHGTDVGGHCANWGSWPEN